MERLLEATAAWFIYHGFEYAFHRLGHWKHPWNVIHTLHIKHHKLSTTYLEIANDEVSPGDSIPIKFTSPSIP